MKGNFEHFDRCFHQLGPTVTTLVFTNADWLDRLPNKYIPLLITTVMANFEVCRILVNQGSSADILFADLLENLNITREDLSPYRGTDLSGLNC